MLSLLLALQSGRRPLERIEEDESLLRYESMLGACANARAELSHAIGMSVGTLDGVLAPEPSAPGPSSSPPATCQSGAGGAGLSFEGNEHNQTLAKTAPRRRQGEDFGFG